MRSLVVLSGPPGAGKTTLAHALAERRPRAVVLERDSFLGFIRAGRTLPWLPEARSQNEVVLRAVARAASAYLNHYEVILDGMITADDLRVLRAELGRVELRLDLVCLLPAREVAVERAFTRSRNERLAISKLRYEQLYDEFASGSPLPGAIIDSSHLTLEETLSKLEATLRSM